MRRGDALLTVANLSVTVFLVLAGPSAAVAAADPGGSHGKSGNGKPGSGQGNSGQRNPGNGNSGNGNSGSGNSGSGGSTTRGNPGGSSSVSAQTNTGSSSNGKGGGNGTSGHNAAAPAPTAPKRPVSVVVAEQHTGTTAGRSWWAAPAVAPPAVEVHAPAAPREDAAADPVSADHMGVPVWAAAQPVGSRSDLFGLAGLVLMPLVGLVVGYRQAKAVRDADLTISP